MEALGMGFNEDFKFGRERRGVEDEENGVG